MKLLTLADLRQLSALELERWLSALLTDFCSGSEERSKGALVFVDPGINVRSRISALTSLFDLLTAPGRQVASLESISNTFHEAVGNLLCHAKVGQFPHEGMQELISLLGTTRAFSQLTALDAALGGGEWGDAHPALFRFAMSSLRSLSSGREAYEACLRLITLPRFPKVYVFDAYEVLISSRPERWAADLLRVSGLMVEVRQKIELERDFEQQEEYEDRLSCMMKELVETVSAWQVSRELGQLTWNTEYLTPAHPVGRILYFLASPQSSVRIVIHPQDGRLVLRSPRSTMEHTIVGLTEAGEIFLMNACRDQTLEAMRATLAEVIQKDITERGNTQDIETWSTLARLNDHQDHLSTPATTDINQAEISNV